MNTPLPNVILPLSVTELYLLYSHARADGAGDVRDTPSPALASLLATLRGVWEDDHADEAMPDAPDWLKALALGEI